MVLLPGPRARTAAPGLRQRRCGAASYQLPPADGAKFSDTSTARGHYTLLAAICALAQNDLKENRRFLYFKSPRLIIVIISINQPRLAFLHSCTHSFFRAILSIQCGSVTHSLSDGQGICRLKHTASLIIDRTAPPTGCYSGDLLPETAGPPLRGPADPYCCILTAVDSTRVTFFALRGQPCFLP